MNFKQIVRDYFTFSRSERKGITILLVIIFLLGVANRIIFYFEKPAFIDPGFFNAEFNPAGSQNNGEPAERLFSFNPNTIDKRALDSLSIPESVKRNLIRYKERGGRYYSPQDFKKIYGVTDSIFDRIEPYIIIASENETGRPGRVEVKKRLFAFNPNTATDSDFLQLGITERQIKTVRNYQLKGGSFSESADFFKIYGMTESQKSTLAPYVIIDENDHGRFPKKFETEKINLEINTVDSVELKKLPGIGNKLSKRIVRYRDLLGGFYTSEQLKEVYGINNETVQAINGMIKVDISKVRKIELNFSDEYELAKHPYIGKHLAGELIKFRTRYGKISNSVVLKDSLIMSNEQYERLKPYL